MSNSNFDNPSALNYINNFKYRTIYGRIKDLLYQGYGLAYDINGNLSSFRKNFNYWSPAETDPFGYINTALLEGGVALLSYDSDQARNLDAMGTNPFNTNDRNLDKFYFPLKSGSSLNIIEECSKTFIQGENVLPGGENEKINYSPICEMFRRMFVKGWIDGEVVDFSSPSVASDVGLAVRPPVIAAPITLSGDDCAIKLQKCIDGNGGARCDSADFCDSFQLGRFGLGSENKTSGDFEIAYNSPLIMRFYAWADPAQMPLRRIMVNKGNSPDSIVVEAESIGNRKPVCSSYGYCISESGSNWSNPSRYTYQIPCNGNWDCVFKNPDGSLVQATCKQNDSSSPNGFGNTEDTGCRPDYYEFFISGLNSGFTYQPKVQVLDNWGWCSGNCGIDNGYSYGCYADTLLNQCDPNRAGAPASSIPWIRYGGSVEVK